MSINMSPISGNNGNINDISNFDSPEVQNTQRRASFLQVFQNDAQGPQKKDQIERNSPDAPPSGSEKLNADALKSLGAAMLSPAALLAALCVVEAAKQNEASIKSLLSQNEANIKDIQTQADKIRTGAAWQLAMGIVGSAVSVGMTAVAGVKTLKLDSSVSQNQFTQGMVKVNNWAAGAKASEQLGGGIGNYISTRYQAENKDLDAKQENRRTMMEQLKSNMQNQRDMINKCIDFMSSMQASMNTTRAKIMG